MIALLKFAVGFFVGQIMGSVYRAGHLGIGASILSAIGITFIICIALDKTFSENSEDDNEKK
jgi:hypothetical protein